MLKLTGLEISMQAPTGFSYAAESKLSNRYDDTQCIEFYFKKRKLAAGFLCSSTDAEFLADFGISTEAANKSSAMDKSDSLKVSTPMSSYDMVPIEINSHTLFSTDVDCDEANGSIYRATSTCNVAIMRLHNGRFLYSNFVLENHTESSRRIKNIDILHLWRSFKISE
ncbi:MAG: hypothetical protein KUL77_04820 [Thermomonas sp.]|uniref:hypothetical protein n=1 Tax=Thermomonas sp. TaxID=1971895 RepID=UPI001EC8CF7F|nr:hypothetical protein [Thermomonas sp.]MBV2208872.1 hypothetical protein [Thermomonas sp.]